MDQQRYHCVVEALTKPAMDWPPNKYFVYARPPRLLGAAREKIVKEYHHSYLSRHHCRWPKPISAEPARRLLCASALLAFDRTVLRLSANRSCSLCKAGAPSPPCTTPLGWPHRTDVLRVVCTDPRCLG